MKKKNLILVGSGASGNKVKKDGDILFATPDNALLLSDGKIFVNDKEQCTIDANDARIIRDALISIGMITI